MSIYAFSGTIPGPRTTLRNRQIRFFLDPKREHEYHGLTKTADRKQRAFSVTTDEGGCWGTVYAEVPHLYVGANTMRGQDPRGVLLLDGDPVEGADTERFGTSPSPLGDVTVIAVTGKYEDYMGVAMAGVVTFTGTVTILDPVAGLMLVPETLTATLSGTGSFSINLPATDTPGVSPSGWTYSVVEIFVGNPHGRSFAISVPHSSAGGTVSLAALAPAQTSQGTTNLPTAFASFTSTQRNALNVAASFTVFDSTLGYLVTFDGSEWKDQAGMTV